MIDNVLKGSRQVMRWWDPFLKALRAPVGLTHVTMWRGHLARKREERGEEVWQEAVNRLWKRMVGFAKWRRGALARCSKGICSLHEDLRAAYDLGE